MDVILRLASIRQSVQYLKVASLAVFVFDYLITLELEVELIWKSSWGFIKIVFLLTRYLPFIDVPLILYYSLHSNLPYKTCSIITSVASWSTSFGILMTEVILIFRTYALWNHDRRILIFLIGLLTVVYTLVVVFLELFLRSLKHGTLPLPPIMRGCFPVSASRILYMDFVMLMVNETVIMFLTLWIGVKRYRHSHNRLVIVLYRDGILYFVYLFVISCTYAIVLIAGPPEYLDLLNTPQRVMHSLLAARILLQVRDMARKLENKTLQSFRVSYTLDQNESVETQ